MLKRVIKKALHTAGLEISHYAPASRTVLEDVLRNYAVDTILDVGANTGQSGAAFRLVGYSGKIVSFEPVSHLYEQLSLNARSDPLWFTEKLAVGRSACQVEIHVSGGHAGASSVLEMTDNVRINAPDQRPIRNELVQTTTLAAILDRHYPVGTRCFLKVDVQGSERDVLEGGQEVLKRIVAMKIEMSLVQNYEGEALLPEMLPYLYKQGFRAVCFENGWRNSQSGELYQVDSILCRNRNCVSAAE